MTSTEVLIDAMEEFGNGEEPCAAIVVFMRPNGAISLIGNSGGVAGMGLLDIAKTVLAREVLSED